MPGPQPPYTHPGPSNYYHHPPPPVPGYPYPPMNGHSPGPYTYPYPAPHMNGHAAVPPSSPRTHAHGRGGFHDASRGAHASATYQNYHHAPQPHHVPQPHHPQHPPYFHPAAHVPIPHTSHSPQPSPASPYPHPPHQKFAPPPHPQPVPYSPPYVSAQNNNAPYHHTPLQNWQSQPPISPLPKHLSMPPPPSLSPLSGHPPRPRLFDGPMDAENSQTRQSEDEPPRSSGSSPSPPAAEFSSESTQSSPSTVSSESGVNTENSPRPASPPPHSATHMNTHDPEFSTSKSSASSTATTASSSVPSSTDFGGWAIWSRRPRDPTRAPALIFSPSACPPDHVLQRAIDETTPPPSPVIPRAALPPTSKIKPTKTVEDSPPEPSEIFSSSTTDVSTAPDTPMPGSPLSTNTSISVTTQAKPDLITSITYPSIATGPPVEVKSEKEADLPAVTSSQQDTTSAVSSDISSVIPSPPVTVTTAPAPKKSWASLLRSVDGEAPSKGLPKSSVIGFSIPASPLPARIPATKRPELIDLLQGKAVPLHGAGPSMPIHPRGLVNSGNMCFANSVLQLLVYCTPFARFFAELEKQLPDGFSTGPSGHNATPLVDATMRFLKEFNPQAAVANDRGLGPDKGIEKAPLDMEDDLGSFMPTYVYEAMREKKRFDNMRGQHQEDAEEFFGFYLDTLEEELLSILSSFDPNASQLGFSKFEERLEETPREEGWLEVGKRNRAVVTRTNKSTESPITRIFGGKFRSTLRVPGQRDSAVVEDWRSLQLDIQRDSVHNIRDALSFISQPQSVQVARPGTVVEASQQVLIENLPPILVLHLKRFLYDVNAKGVVKIGKQVQFAPELDIPLDIIAPAKRSMPRHYRLYGVLYHHGVSASGGHYTLDILHPNRDMTTSGRPREAWVRFDDELVSDVRPEDVFNGWERDDRCAYLLFYKLAVPPRTL